MDQRDGCIKAERLDVRNFEICRSLEFTQTLCGILQGTDSDERPAYGVDANGLNGVRDHGPTADMRGTHGWHQTPL